MSMEMIFVIDAAAERRLYYTCHSPRGAAHAALAKSLFCTNGDTATFINFNRKYLYSA